MYTLQKLLTHKSPVMPQRYAHLRDEALKNALQLAGNLINSKEILCQKYGISKKHLYSLLYPVKKS